MKKAYLIGATLCVASVLQAALVDVVRDGRDAAEASQINLSGADQTGTPVASVVWTDPAGGNNNADAVRTKAYTINGIDFDGDTIEDVLTWTLTLDGELQGINAAGEGTSFDIFVDGAVANSRSGYSSTVTFNGFTQFRSNANDPDAYALGTDGIGSTDIGTGLTNNTEFAAVEQFTASWESGGFSVSNIDYSFTVDTIPEPTVLGLLGVSGACILFLRRVTHR